eukprot:XP_011679733.1 PREDICTED: uncharacterized protein LOC105445643 [Strongylocentrotus purpuratus]
MANSFSVLLPYIDDLWWFCTQLIYMIVSIIDFIYKVLTALFKGFVQLWRLSVHIGNAFVFIIEFLPELPVRSFHLGKNLFELVLNLMNDAAQACMSWFWATLANSLEKLTAIFKNLGLAFFSVWTQLFDLLVFYCVSFLKAIVDSFVRVFEDLIKIVCSNISNIANGLYYIIINTLKEIPTFLITVIDYLGQTVGAVFESAAEGYSSISSFIIKNWGALLALTLFITLVWVFINMRNIQNILKDLTQIVNSFTHNLPHEIDREQVRPEGHLQHNIHPQGQQQVELQDRNEGDEESGNTGRTIHPLHFTSSGEPSGENKSVKSTISDLENRLIEEEEKHLCVVCQDAVKDTAFVPCRHLCVCLPCADKIMSNEKILSRNCPLCRTKIGSIFQVYS